MSKGKYDSASQGTAANAERPLGPSRSVATPNAGQIIRSAGRDVARKDAADTKPRPPQKVGGKQDWRR
jgi:hypothetical protein